ncbi:MAG: 3-isopropylmalate dehydratase small subunit [Armatimonadota bacterium]|nr:3-isopropylmalate dehydratase small subunit [Armatimonadota bacterium]MDR7450445.1 3-isopropylmalate dehydratase small subunit [Armatimonadota bacterium]MDR7466972.1 3-isopropylmalate dehydratase small subunit [Armatimonadota bacterium]MDR7493486.1 3-isopropylmalate dehydratase small subunit [Armatimonadota bacterium]MDR7498751.1 3-isopropylmalate dehydratase small subunit [Armatimonadota bacterium]
MIRRGRAHVVGHHIDTDVIIPARYLVTADPADLARHAFEDLDPSLREQIGEGDILIAGENFGQGSSREHAPLALRGLGLAAVVAASFARIFYRNAFNVGLPLLECPAAAGGVRDGDVVEVDFGAGTVRNLTRGDLYRGQPIPEFMQRLVDAGGLVGYIRAQRRALQERG